MRQRIVRSRNFVIAAMKFATTGDYKHSDGFRKILVDYNFLICLGTIQKCYRNICYTEKLLDLLQPTSAESGQTKWARREPLFWYFLVVAESMWNLHLPSMYIYCCNEKKLAQKCSYCWMILLEIHVKYILTH